MRTTDFRAFLPSLQTFGVWGAYALRSLPAFQANLPMTENKISYGQTLLRELLACISSAAR